MHIFSADLGKDLDMISMFFTESEAVKLIAELDKIIEEKFEKIEFSDEDKQKSITIVKNLYREEPIV